MSNYISNYVSFSVSQKDRLIRLTWMTCKTCPLYIYTQYYILGDCATLVLCMFKRRKERKKKRKKERKKKERKKERRKKERKTPFVLRLWLPLVLCVLKCSKENTFPAITELKSRKVPSQKSVRLLAPTLSHSIWCVRNHSALPYFVV